MVGSYGSLPGLRNMDFPAWGVHCVTHCILKTMERELSFETPCKPCDFNILVDLPSSPLVIDFVTLLDCLGLSLRQLQGCAGCADSAGGEKERERTSWENGKEKKSLPEKDTERERGNNWADPDECIGQGADRVGRRPEPCG
ncbi:UNVERIFIED_CONTAM: hypothetical protein FKN15_014525 [Acipenser sinensis]